MDGLDLTALALCEIREKAAEAQSLCFKIFADDGTNEVCKTGTPKNELIVRIQKIEQWARAIQSASD